MSPEIEHLAAEGRFQLRIDGALGSLWAVIDYTLRDGVMAIHHTGVPPELEGQGIAGRLTKAALDHAQAHGWKVSPRCSYAAAYMRRHPETQPLLARD